MLIFEMRHDGDWKMESLIPEQMMTRATVNNHNSDCVDPLKNPVRQW